MLGSCKNTDHLEIYDRKLFKERGYHPRQTQFTLWWWNWARQASAHRVSSLLVWTGSWSETSFWWTSHLFQLEERWNMRAASTKVLTCQHALYWLGGTKTRVRGAWRQSKSIGKPPLIICHSLHRQLQAKFTETLGADWTNSDQLFWHKLWVSVSGFMDSLFSVRLWVC